MTNPWRRWVLLMLLGAPAALPVLAGCGVGGDGGGLGEGGAPGAGGATGSARGTGGTTGGSAGTGGAAAAGGRTAMGGASADAGAQSGGGGTSTGGVSGGGGETSTGGVSGGGGSSNPRDGGVSPDTSPAADALPPSADAEAAGVRLQGRFDFTDATRPSFGWSGSAMLARFTGTGATLRIDGSPNQFTVVVDGAVSSQALKVASGTTQYPLASGLAAGLHDVVVWKRTEGNQGENRFLGLDVAEGQLRAPPVPPDRRIEIYGDSITTGYGLDGKGPNCSWSADTDNHYLTYGAITARELSAELHTVAWSGIGMYRNYDKKEASPDAMPFVYARTLPTESSSSWAFSTWQPHVVVINLGTNDASTHGDPGAPYRTAYLDFVRTLRQKYPDTYFVLSIGPMLDGAELAAIKGHIQAVIEARASEGDERLSFLEFPVQSQADGLGCDWHPNATTNAKMATLLVAELKARLGW